MAKKTIEKPTMAVTTTVVESIEKPKKSASRKKRATVISRSADEVLGEIVNDTNETDKTEIRKASNKKVSTLRRISNKGEINLNDISDSELKEFITIGKKLNVHDKMSISNYGSELSAQLNRSTKELMSLSRSTNLADETAAIIRGISSKLMEINLDDIKRPNAIVRTIRKIPVLNKFMFSVKKFLAKYDTLEKAVEATQEKLQSAQAIALRDNNELEKRFQNTVDYLGVLEKLIIAAKIKSNEYEQAIATMEANPDDYPPITIHEVKTFKHELDKRITNMLTWHLTFNQSLFRIRDIQDANIAHSNSISETIDNMMPMLRDQLQQAVVLYNLEQGIKAHDVMINGFNEILRHNADATHDVKVRVTERTEQTAISLETLKYNQEKIIETQRDVLRIMEDAAKKRLASECEMATMERKLNQMMSGVESNNVKLCIVSDSGPQ